MSSDELQSLPHFTLKEIADATYPELATAPKKEPPLSAADVTIQIGKLLSEIKLTGNVTGSQEDMIARLDHNILKLGELKSLYLKVFVQQQIRLEAASVRLKNAKQEFSKKLYNKKFVREQQGIIELIQRMTVLDASIKNIQTRKEKLLNPEPTVTTPEVTDAEVVQAEVPALENG